MRRNKWVGYTYAAWPKQLSESVDRHCPSTQDFFLWANIILYFEKYLEIQLNLWRISK